MPVGIGAAGILGVAIEATAGTYLAPTKFLPINSESLSLSTSPNWNREIKGVADITSVVQGNSSIEGTIEVIVRHDTLPYFLHAARATVVKSGTAPNFLYTYTPSSAAEAPNKTLSITVVRNGVTFGYVGCVITSMEFSVDNGQLIASFNVIGRNESSQTLPTATYSNVTPFGAGTYNLQIPTATQVFDVSEFTFSVDDSGEPQYRLRNDRFTPSFVKFGERSVTLSTTRDFENRTEYDAFKALTGTSVTLRAELTANYYVSFAIPNAVRESYEVGLGGQGDILTAGVNFNAVHNGSPTYTIVVGTSENIT